MTPPVFDIIIVGGGIAGSSLGGVLARAGLGVLVVEKEARFRDRIRGERTWPWGWPTRDGPVDDLLDAAGTVDIVGVKRYENRQRGATVWDDWPRRWLPGIGFLTRACRKRRSPGRKRRAPPPSVLPKRRGSRATVLPRSP